MGCGHVPDDGAHRSRRGFEVLWKVKTRCRNDRKSAKLNQWFNDIWVKIVYDIDT